MHLLFDFTFFHYGIRKSKNRGGIYFTAYNILTYFLKQNDFKVTLYARYNIENLKKEFNRLFPDHASTKIIGDEENFTQFDIFFSPAFATPPILAENYSIKKVFILYDIIPLLIPEYFMNGVGWFFDVVKEITSNNYYFSISEYTKYDFARYVPQLDSKKVTTTLLAASDKFYCCRDEEKIKKVKNKYNIPDNKKYILSLCTLEPRKNLVLALKAFFQFIENNNIQDIIYVLGGGSLSGFIEKMEEHLAAYPNWKQYILRIGYVDDEDLAPLYSGALFFTYTSLYEGFGLPPLEAMQCGTPVVTSNTSSIPEVVGNSALSIEPTSMEEHISAFTSLYYDDKLCKYYSEAGLQRAKEFSWAKCSSIIIEKILEIGVHSTPKLSIIVPCFHPFDLHFAAQLELTLQSIQQQTYVGEIEPIAVFSSANEVSAEIFRTYENQGRLKVCFSNSANIYEAINAGISQSTGKYITFLCPGDFYHNADGLTLAIRTLENTSADYCTSDVKLDSNESPSPIWAGNMATLPINKYYALQSMVLKLSTAQGLSGFNTTDEKHAAHNFMLHLAQLNKKYVYNNTGYIVVKDVNTKALSATCSDADHAHLFFHWFGKSFNLTLYDCLVLAQFTFFDTCSAHDLFHIASKLQNPLWIYETLSHIQTISKKSIIQHSATTREVLRFLRYKIYSHIFFGARKKRYREKYLKMKSHLLFHENLDLEI